MSALANTPPEGEPKRAFPRAEDDAERQPRTERQKLAIIRSAPGSRVRQGLDYTRDTDPVETKEWLDSLDGVIEVEGPERAHYLLHRVMDGARRKGAPVPYSANTPYLNTIPIEKQPPHPGDRAIEHRIRSIIRWNALE